MSTTTTTAPSPLSGWETPAYFAPSSNNPRRGSMTASSPAKNEPSSPGYFNLPYSASAASSTSCLFQQGQSDRTSTHERSDSLNRDIQFTRRHDASTPWAGSDPRTPLPHKPNNAGRRPATTPQQQQQQPRTPTPESARPTLTSSPEQCAPEPRLTRITTDPLDFQGAVTSTSTNAPPRADTSPASVDHGGVRMISPQECVELLSSKSEETLLLDVRPAAQHGASRIRSCLNLCIPTTLLKRPSFNLQKVQSTLGTDVQKQRLQEWKTSTHLVVYDSSTAHLRDAQTLVSVLQKFTNEGFRGHALILRGRFSDFATEFPDWVDNDRIPAGNSPSSPSGPRATDMSLSINIAGPPQSTPRRRGSKSGAGQSPSKDGLGMGLCRSIRQNTDLVDGVGQISLHLPPSMTDAAVKTLPRWLREASEVVDAGKRVADKFLAIEKAEQSRMQKALGDSSMYCASSPSPKRSPTANSEKPRNKRTCRIAGIEKGLKNRYSNIYPYDHTRVRLQDVSQSSCDYINASHAKSSRSNRRYIATQAPLPTTFDDFWRVVWEQDVRVIVMLTAESEGPQRKCHPYWNGADYGPIQVKELGERSVPLDKKKQVPTKKQKTSPGAEDTPQMLIRHLSLSHTSQPFQPIREVTQLQYADWPDFGAPAEPSHLLRLVAECDRAARRPSASGTPANLSEPAWEDPHRILVHCSAGCGRTGTFCTVDSVIDLLKRQRWERLQGPKPASPIPNPLSPSFLPKAAAEVTAAVENISEACGYDPNWLWQDDDDLIASTVEEFRTQRPSMVQSLTQFALCYDSVLEWMAEMGQWPSSTPPPQCTS